MSASSLHHLFNKPILPVILFASKVMQKALPFKCIKCPDTPRITGYISLALSWVSNTTLKLCSPGLVSNPRSSCLSLVSTVIKTEEYFRAWPHFLKQIQICVKESTRLRRYSISNMCCGTDKNILPRHKFLVLLS